MNLCEVVICYRELFWNENNCWLKCPGDYDDSDSLCRCLDSVQLDLAGLYDDTNENPDISFTSPKPYIVAFSDPKNNANSNTNLTWCSDKFHVKNAMLSKKTKKLLHEITNYWLILLILCLYKANTRAMRGKVTEFYLASHPKAFSKYVYELAKKVKNRVEGTDDNALPDDILAMHIAMIQRILKVYADDMVREQLWTEANLYDALTCDGFKRSIAKEPIDKDRLKNNLEKTRKTYNGSSFLPDEDFLNAIHIIFYSVKPNQPGLRQNTSDIVESLKLLNKKSADYSKTKIEIMLKLKDLLPSFS